MPSAWILWRCLQHGCTRLHSQAIPSGALVSRTHLTHSLSPLPAGKEAEIIKLRADSSFLVVECRCIQTTAQKLLEAWASAAIPPAPITRLRNACGIC